MKCFVKRASRTCCHEMKCFEHLQRSKLSDDTLAFENVTIWRAVRLKQKKIWNYTSWMCLISQYIQFQLYKILAKPVFISFAYFLLLCAPSQTWSSVFLSYCIILFIFVIASQTWTSFLFTVPISSCDIRLWRPILYVFFVYICFLFTFACRFFE